MTSMSGGAVMRITRVDAQGDHKVHEGKSDGRADVEGMSAELLAE